MDNWQKTIDATGKLLEAAARSSSSVGATVQELSLRRELRLDATSAEEAPLLHCGLKASVLSGNDQQLDGWAKLLGSIVGMSSRIRSRLEFVVASAQAASALRSYERGGKTLADLDRCVEHLEQAQPHYGQAYGVAVGEVSLAGDGHKWTLRSLPSMHPAVRDLVTWYASEQVAQTSVKHDMNVALYRPPRTGSLAGEGVVVRLVLERVPDAGMPYADPRWTTFFDHEDASAPDAETVTGDLLALVLDGQFAQTFQESIDTSWACATTGVRTEEVGVRWWLERRDNRNPIAAEFVAGGSLGGAFAAGFYSILREPGVHPDPTVVICATINAEGKHGPVSIDPARHKWNAAKAAGIDEFVVVPEMIAHLPQDPAPRS